MRVVIGLGALGAAHDLAAVVDVTSRAVHAAECTEVVQLSTGKQKGVLRQPGGVGAPDDAAVIVHAAGEGDGAAQGPDVGHRAIVPEERVRPTVDPVDEAGGLVGNQGW